MTEPTVYELSAPRRSGIDVPEPDVPAAALPEGLLREDNGLPELSQRDLVRHFLHLSQRNFGIRNAILVAMVASAELRCG